MILKSFLSKNLSCIVLVRKPRIWGFFLRDWKSLNDIVIFILCVKINRCLENFLFIFYINDEFQGIWELLFILEIILQNVEIVLKWLIVKDT